MMLSPEALDRIENGTIDTHLVEKLKATMLDCYGQMEMEGFDLSDFHAYINHLILKAGHTAQKEGHFETF